MARSKKIQGNIEVVNLVANDPTLIEQTPSTNEQGEQYVEFGAKDDHFQYMLDCYINSATHGAICNGMILRILAKGLDKPEVVEYEDLKRFVTDRYIMGNAAWQKVNGKLMHVPVNYLRKHPANEDEHVLEFEYSTEWDQGGNGTDRKTLPNGQHFPNAPHSIYWTKSYAPNTFYYGLPNFENGLAYAELEIALSKHLNKTVHNSFSVTKIINFNNGAIPDEQERKLTVKKVKDSVTGENGEPVIVAFNPDKDSAATVDDISVDNAAEKYQYISTEAQQKLIVAHGITSPLLLGIRDTGSGLGSNKDEMLQADEQLMKYQVEPLQREIEESIFKATGERVKFINTELETTQLSEQKTALQEFLDCGEDDPEGYELFSNTEVDYSIDDDLDEIMESHFKPTLLSRVNNVIELVTTGKASPKTKSKQDTPEYAVRYRYVRGGKPNKTDANGKKYKDRAFCLAMEKANKLYRKEDIQAMRNKPVNPGFGEKGARTYDIWLYKGGARCRHKWFREVYVKKGISDKSRIDLGKRISVAQARRNGAKIETNPAKVAIVPDNMKNKGFVTRSTMPSDAKAQNTGI